MSIIYQKKWLNVFVAINNDLVGRVLSKLLNRPAPPEKIVFPAFNDEWRITYQKHTQPSRTVTLVSMPDKQLVVIGRRYNATSRQLLTKWVKHYAKKILPAQLMQLSEKTQLTFRRITIRDQRTRWGSCSSDHSINLNYKLIFLPTELIHYVMIHELCHTKHLNHSQHFWHLVESFDPHYREHRRALKQPEKYFPEWLSSS